MLWQVAVGCYALGRCAFETPVHGTRPGRPTSADTRIIAASRAGLDASGYRDKVRGELGRFVAADALDDETVHRFLARLHYASIDFADASTGVN